MRALPLLVLLGGFAAWGVAGCDDSGEPIFPASSTTGGPGGTTGGSGSGGASGSATTAGSAGTAGSGATFTSCQACGGDAPICVDESACAAVCPAGRDLCHPAGAVAGGACCGAGEQCCEAQVFGYLGGDICRPEGEACPLGCPNSDVACPLQQYCVLDGVNGGFKCQEACPAHSVCGFNLCCPIGSQCKEGTCALPDLTIDAEQIVKSVSIEVVDFPPDACEILEGCVGGSGKRTLMRFDLRTPNIGLGDLELGNPTGNDLFQYSQCHDHYHFQSYADYALLDQNGDTAATGHKQAFCLEDVQPNTDPPMGNAFYTCDYQGIQAGWSDVYHSGLPCQWVDITDVPAGDYKLRVSVNFAKVIVESDFTNDSVEVDVVVPENSCPNGCLPVDAACCKPDDPCGWANNLSCDCSAYFDWDAADCSQCYGSDPLCTSKSSCSRGCSPNQGPCCAADNPCGLADNYACDCEDVFDWDKADCGTCNNPAPPCPVNTCPNGCTPLDVASGCCEDGNPCGWNNDSFCDCGGQFDWDNNDCGHCTTGGPDCPQP